MRQDPVLSKIKLIADDYAVLRVYESSVVKTSLFVVFADVATAAMAAYLTLGLKFGHVTGYLPRGLDDVGNVRLLLVELSDLREQPGGFQDPADRLLR